MAIADNAVWEIRSTATAGNANGGFFVPGASGVDYSQQNAAQFNLTGCTTSAASATVANANAAASMVGNGAHIISGTNFTPGFYQIISVVVGVSMTLDRVCSTAAASVGVINIGGALSLGGTVAGSTDDDVFEAARPGHIYYVKAGSYTLGGNITLSASVGGSIANPAKITGYNTTRGDNPTGTGNQGNGLARPVINTANFAWSHNIGQYWTLSFLEITGTPSTIVFQASQGTIVDNCKVTNTSLTAGRTALALSGANCMAISSEFMSVAGTALLISSISHVLGCYIRGSTTGLSDNATGNGFSVEDCLFESNTTAISLAAALTGASIIKGNTIFGAATPAGTGINVTTTGSGNIKVINNIIYGFVTGVSVLDAANNCYGDYNCYFNNTTNRTNFMTGANDNVLNPSFAGVGNYQIGTNIRATGFPRSFPGNSATLSYPSNGAVRRDETASQPAITSVINGVVFDSGLKTGTAQFLTLAQFLALK